MRLSVVLLAAALAGVIGGAWLAGGLPGVGGAVIFDSLAVAAYALLHDDGKDAVQQVHGPPDLHDVLERARGA